MADGVSSIFIPKEILLIIEFTWITLNFLYKILYNTYIDLF